jgi:hypothetical protein
MQYRRLLAGVVLVGGVLGAGSAALAQDLGTADDSEAGGGRTLRLYAAAAEDDIDVAYEADGGEPDDVLEVGDREIFSETLWRVNRHDEPYGDPIGRVYIDCTTFAVTDPDPDVDEEGDDATLQCIASADLPHGNLYLQTVFSFSDFFDPGYLTGGVTGGDGELTGAAGEFRLFQQEPTPEAPEGSSIYEVRLVGHG